MNLADRLAVLTRTPGVRGALVIAADDGLVVADALMEGVDGGAVAALAASLAARMTAVTRALGLAPPQLLHLEGTQGGLLAVPAPGGLLVVAVTDPDPNVGELRLGLRGVAEGLA